MGIEPMTRQFSLASASPAVLPLNYAGTALWWCANLHPYG
jgi:hypothetical protein